MSPTDLQKCLDKRLVLFLHVSMRTDALFLQINSLSNTFRVFSFFLLFSLSSTMFNSNVLEVTGEKCKQNWWVLIAFIFHPFAFIPRWPSAIYTIRDPWPGASIFSESFYFIDLFKKTDIFPLGMIFVCLNLSVLDSVHTMLIRRRYSLCCFLRQETLLHIVSLHPGV